MRFERALTNGRVVVLNGVPCSGKSSIANHMLDSFDGVWINLGVDLYAKLISPGLLPGIGLRPGGDVPISSRLFHVAWIRFSSPWRLTPDHGINVAVDIGLHDVYSRPLGLRGVSRHLRDLPTLIVGVRCPLNVILARRKSTGYPDDPTVAERWEAAVHSPGIYDLELDTSTMTPFECVKAVRRALANPPALPTAVERILTLGEHGESY